jgi:lysophospholipase L1-like esterase
MPRAGFSRVLLLLLGAGVACLLLGEASVKLVFFGLHASPREILAPSPDPALVYELVPDTRATFTYLNPRQTRWRYEVTINGEGFRGAPSRPDVPGPRIAVLGDSYAFGLGVDDAATFVAQLGVLLGERAEVLNWGVPGYNLVQEAALLRERLERHAPDVVVVALHPNDFEPPVFEDAAQVRWVRRSHLYSILLHARFRAAEDLDAQLARDRPERVRRAREAFDALLALSQERDFALVLFRIACWPGYDGGVVDHFVRDQRLRGVPFIDLDALACARLEENQIPDDGHPTAQGHLLLAELLHAGLEPLLAQREIPFDRNSTEPGSVRHER